MDNQARATSQSTLVRLRTDAAFRRRLLRFALGLPTPLDTEDRRVLEEIIFKEYLADPGVRSILFVGVDWYTKHYAKSFFRGKNLWTLDMLPSTRKFGARQHVICALAQATQHFAAGSFDLIVCNGVYGHGMNAKADCEGGFEACFKLLREGGFFVLGWNDVPEHTFVPLVELDSLAKFTPCKLRALDTHRYLTATPYRHVYQFYEKRTQS
ncbi:MAG TPA: class I SAM-dependent methyltransferase [Steroidobacteraceae bacterium]|nr:class I SAM-dependent methyltransferase [Steroidobacteraceae bacterium]